MSERPNFTPGPWSADADRGSSPVVVKARGRAGWVCECVAPIDDRHEQVANSHLIAAAPEMYAALKLAMHVLGNAGSQTAYEQAYLAICHAEGVDFLIADETGTERVW